MTFPPKQSLRSLLSIPAAVEAQSMEVILDTSLSHTSISSVQISKVSLKVLNFLHQQVTSPSLSHHLLSGPPGKSPHWSPPSTLAPTIWSPHCCQSSLLETRNLTTPLPCVKFFKDFPLVLNEDQSLVRAYKILLDLVPAYSSTSSSPHPCSLLLLPLMSFSSSNTPTFLTSGHLHMLFPLSGNSLLFASYLPG